MACRGNPQSWERRNYREEYVVHEHQLMITVTTNLGPSKTSSVLFSDNALYIIAVHKLKMRLSSYLQSLFREVVVERTALVPLVMKSDSKGAYWGRRDRVSSAHVVCQQDQRTLHAIPLFQLS